MHATPANRYWDSNAAIRKAEQLHSDLCAVQLPQESVIVDSGDDLTPANHLVRIAEAYRCTGLLQLYRNFPDLLSPFTSTLEGELQDGGFSGVSDSEKMADAWLVCLALHILDLIQDVPLSSRTRSIQPLLLVSICSDLKLGNFSYVFADNGKAPVESILSSRRFKGTVHGLRRSTREAIHYFSPLSFREYSRREAYPDYATTGERHLSKNRKCSRCRILDGCYDGERPRYAYGINF